MTDTQEAELRASLRKHSMPTEAVQRDISIYLAVAAPENKRFADRLEADIRAANWFALDGGTITDRRYQKGIWLFGVGPSDPQPPSVIVLQNALESIGIPASIDKENTEESHACLVVGKRPQ
jgi:hypothetical protein